jgi:TIR domain
VDSHIFISHSSKDQKVARTICTALENRGLACWVYSRNIQPGQNFQEQIVKAIRAAKIMVLVFTSNANASNEIKKELALASQHNLVVIPVRIEDVVPNEAFAYELSTRQWIDLFEDWEGSITRLADLISTASEDRSGAPAKAISELPLATVVPASEPTQPRSTQRTALTFAPASASAPKRSFALPLIAASAVALLAAAAGFWFYLSRTTNTPLLTASVSPPIASGQSNFQTLSGAGIALVPEDVPFIRDAEKATLRNDYLAAPDHKALALSFIHAGMSSSQKDDETAISAALESCQTASDAVQHGGVCQLYAIGNMVVYKAGRPPMPPEPWVQDDPSVARPFVPDQAPIIPDGRRPDMQTYANARAPKALAISSAGSFAWRYGNASQDEAVRRALEICGAISHFACLLVAVDNSFVVPVPTTMKAIGFFHAATEPLITAELRPDVVRRLGNAARGWNVVAVGTSGKPNLALKGGAEQSAVDEALEKCRAVDRECRIIAIGPFRVAPLPAQESQSAVR